MDVSWATLLAARTLGFFGEDSPQEALREDPYNPDLLSVYPYVPGYLDLIEEWLRGLRR